MQTEISALILQQKILPLFYHHDLDTCTGVIDSLYEGGIRSVEFTNRGSKALQNLQSLVQQVSSRWPGLEIGAGTILSATDAKAFIDAGASFIISPGLLASVGEVVLAEKILWIPGCLTPSEIMDARERTLRLVKIFPGSLGGPAYITALREVFRDMNFLPTGGVDISVENLTEWFRAGVGAVGIGGKLISKQALENKDFPLIKSLLKQALDVITACS